MIHSAVVTERCIDPRRQMDRQPARHLYNTRQRTTLGPNRVPLSQTPSRSRPATRRADVRWSIGLDSADRRCARSDEVGGYQGADGDQHDCGDHVGVAVEPFAVHLVAARGSDSGEAQECRQRDDREHEQRATAAGTPRVAATRKSGRIVRSGERRGTGQSGRRSHTEY